LSVSDLDVVENTILAPYTTFQLGGPCKGLLFCQSPKDLEYTIKQLAADNERFILIGGGSNLVISDQGVDCYVVRYATQNPLIECSGNKITVAASVSLDVLAEFATEKGLAGLTCLSGIPGTVGGAVVGNAGAFGKQIGDVIETVEVITPQGQLKTLSKEDCGFSYRDSRLKETKDIVMAITVSLAATEVAQSVAQRPEILALRREKHPDLMEHPCAGSFFRNIEPTSSAEKRQAAGWFLDQAGGKELSHGGAKIFEKHANIIVKGDACTAQDVYELHVKMAYLVKKKFDLDLVREVRFVGSFSGEIGKQDIIW